MKTVIEMAREAGFYEDEGNVYGGHLELERFAELIRADTMEEATRAANESWTLLAKALVLAEREACAKMVEDLNEIGHSYGLENRIRARGNP